MTDVTAVSTGDDVPCEVRGVIGIVVRNQSYRPRSPFKSQGVLAEPDVVFLQPVAGDGDRPQAGGYQFLKTC